MAVDGDIHVLHAFHVFLQIADQAVHLIRSGVTHGIRHVQNRCTCGHSVGVALGQELPVGTGAVLSGELNIVTQTLCVGNILGDAFQNFLAAHLQLIVHMDIAGSNENMDARLLGALDCAPGCVDIALGAAGQRCHRAVMYGLRNGFHALEVLGGNDGEACFNHVHAQSVQLTGHLQLFGEVHAAAGGLLAVAQGRVENLDSFHAGGLLEICVWRSVEK